MSLVLHSETFAPVSPRTQTRTKRTDSDTSSFTLVSHKLSTHNKLYVDTLTKHFLS